MSLSPMLALLLDSKSCAVWQYQPSSQSWRNLPIKGDARFVHHQDRDTINQVLLAVADSLNDVDWNKQFLHILCAKTVRPLLKGLLDTCQQHNIQDWQQLDLDYWQHTAKQHGVSSIDWLVASAYERYLLPLLVNRLIPKLQPASFGKEKKLTQSESRSRSTSHSELQRKVDELTRLNTQYSIQIRGLRADLEGRIVADPTQHRDTLITFLPVIFRDFWQHITPADVASLLNSTQIPTVPSPFPYADVASRLAKRKQFLGLSAHEQQSIWQFCTTLEYHHLTVNPEFKPLFDQWLEQDVS